MAVKRRDGLVEDQVGDGVVPVAGAEYESRGLLALAVVQLVVDGPAMQHVAADASAQVAVPGIGACERVVAGAAVDKEQAGDTGEIAEVEGLVRCRTGQPCGLDAAKPGLD